MKKFLSILIVSLFVLSACSAKVETTSQENTEDVIVTDDTLDNQVNTEEKEDDDSTIDSQVIEEDIINSNILELTLEELETYDGTNGNPAYIAIDGKIYDVSDIPNWSGGKHNGFTAGKDLTKEMKEISPHGVSKLQLVEEVGIIIE